MRTRVEPSAVLTDDKLQLRRFGTADIEQLPALCNDAGLAANLRDTFPHPYGLPEAEFFVGQIATQNEVFAVCMADQLVGCVGGIFRQDVHRDCIEVGYWVGRAFWGQAVATRALRLLCAHLIATQSALLRLEADVFGGNEGSARVLENNGFVREGTRLRRVRKGAEVRDEWLYARVL